MCTVCTCVCVVCEYCLTRRVWRVPRRARPCDLRRDLASRWFTISLICAGMALVLLQLIAKAYTVPATTLPAKAYDTILRGGVVAGTV